MATIPVNNKKRKQKKTRSDFQITWICAKKEEAELFLKKRGLPKDFSKVINVFLASAQDHTHEFPMDGNVQSASSLTRSLSIHPTPE